MQDNKINLKRIGKKYLEPNERVRVRLTRDFMGIYPQYEAMTAKAGYHELNPTVPTAKELIEAPAKLGEGTSYDENPYLTVEDLPEDWLELMMKEARQGRGTVSYMRVLGVTKAGFETLLSTSPVFASAYEQCLMYCAEWYDNAGRELITGEIKGNGTVWLANMVNKFGWNSEKTQSKTNVESQSTVKIAELTEEEALAELKRRGINPKLFEE